ncbi:MAG: GTP diphosphokinase [Gammaproteobacteria bacterium]|nr:GTP diphosphokinase [Gammaproteobacteria bacterium]
MVQVNALYQKIQSGEINQQVWLESILSVNHNLDEKAMTATLVELNVLCTVSKVISYKDFLLSLETATILAELNMDSESAIVGLLLIAFHKQVINKDWILEKYDSHILDLLQGVNKMDAIKNIQSKLESSKALINNTQKADQLRKMFIAMVSDPRVVVIRLADHLCELRSVRKADKETQERLAEETRLIYGPLANRLGIGQIKWELEDLAFRYLEGDTYKNIAKLLDEKRIDRDNYIVNLIKAIKEKLSLHNIKADVSGRVKHIYSIWRKMQRKNLDYHELYDIRAVRILTHNITDCYAALGLVHSLWRHIPKEFDDYIATPKENGYQSLHTAVIGPEGKTVEVQIRTHDMHKDSELGVAAHWRYKERVAHDGGFEAKIAWLRQLISWQDEVASASDLLEELKTDIAEERVYVFTPGGDVIDLPEGSTPLDFAYTIHTDIGNKCRGAVVNGKMVQLTYQLCTGDRVDILTKNNSSPSRDWLNPHFNYLKTPRARAKVQSWFKKQDYDRNISEGREMLHAELNRLGVSLELSKISRKLNYKTDDDILAGIGRGDLKISQVLNAANLEIHPNRSTTHGQTEIIPIPDIIKKQPKTLQNTKGINILGVGDLLTSLARCCKPIPGNPIIGYVSQGQGVTIHAQDCQNIYQLQNIHPERLIEASWGEDTANILFSVDIFVQSRDRHGLLRDMTGLLSAEKINISNLKTDTDKNGIVHTYVTIDVRSVDELGRILDRMQALPNVMMVKRITGKNESK